MTYTSPTSVNMTKGFPELLIYLNTVTDSWISNMILLSIYIIAVAGYYKSSDDFSGALAIAGFGTFIISLLFWMGGFVSGVTFGIVIGIAIIGVLVLLMDNRN